MKLVFKLKHYNIHPTARYRKDYIYPVIPGPDFNKYSDPYLEDKYRNCIAFVEFRSFKKYVALDSGVWQPYINKKL